MTKKKIVWPAFDKNNLAPLHEHYEGQITAQPAYLEVAFDDDDAVQMRFGISSDAGQPASVYSSEILRFSVSPQISVTAMRKIAACSKIAGFIERIAAGHTIDCYSSNSEVSMTADAQDAADSLADLLQYARWSNAEVEADAIGNY